MSLQLYDGFDDEDDFEIPLTCDVKRAVKSISDRIYEKALQTSPKTVSNNLYVMSMLETDERKRELLLIAATQLLETDFFRGRLQS